MAWRLHHLDRSCERLQVRESGLVADDAVLAREFGGGERVFRVDDFENRCFAGGIAAAESGEGSRAQCTLWSRLELIGGNGFGIELFELRDELALGGGEGGARLIAVDLALANAVAGGEPVPEREIHRSAGGVAEVAVPSWFSARTAGRRCRRSN